MVAESKEDLMAAYKLDPNNKAVRKELQLLKVFAGLWALCIMYKGNSCFKSQCIV